VAAIQDIGTRMVVEAQKDSGALASQDSGGPAKVTKILAAIISGIRDVVEEEKGAVPICSEEKIPVQRHSTHTIEAMSDDNLRSTKDLLFCQGKAT
jgi:hypothetical protein